MILVLWACASVAFTLGMWFGWSFRDWTARRALEGVLSRRIVVLYQDLVVVDATVRVLIAFHSLDRGKNGGET